MPKMRSERKPFLLTAAVITVCLVSCPPAPPAPFETETFTLPGGVPLEMIYLPSGTFMMGRYPGEQEGLDSEDPQHPVTVPGFWMGTCELTKEQWTAIMETTPWTGQDNVLEDPESPAVYVSWDDAKAFIRALSTYTGKTFRLPSEAEWEYGCRAGTLTRFYWGDDPDYAEGDDYCWWGYNAEDVSEAYAHVSGSKLSNAFDMHDMSGNVWEWCEDDWHYDYVGAPTDSSPWVKSPRGVTRVLRGGTWQIHGNSCRSASRTCVDRSIRTSAHGFRLAR